MARFFIRSRLSDRIAETPEGYLLCSGVPIARTGSLDYLPEEVGIDAAEGSETVTVYRLAEDLFAPAAMASFEGKPFTVDHPDEDVNPGNWQSLAAGHVQNVARGTGAEADLLLGDVLVTTAAAIKAVRSGMREISCGYDAEYVAIAPGVGRQIKIQGNHVALVDAGRCGARVAIRDGDHRMKAKKKGLLAAIFGSPAIRKVIDADPKVKKALDDAIAQEVADSDGGQQQQPVPAGDEDTTQTTDDDPQAEMLLLLRSILQKLDQGGVPATAGDDDPTQPATDEDPIQAGDEDTVQASDEDPQPQTQDARRRRVADAATIGRAALVAPGLAFRSGDLDATVKRAALRAAKDAGVRRTIDAIVGRRAIESLDRPTLDAAFAAAAEVARARTNRRTADGLTDAQGGGIQIKIDTPATLNAQFAKYRDNLGSK